tara:strand:- start:462 stop:986 length:525 start_codon:yes stop_codon:yes gene_type:complete
MKLNELAPKEGSVKNRIRVGRGIGSGKGKTAGSGHKGQKARKGVAIDGFEGGQMPLYMRMPKRGFNAWRPKSYTAVKIARLNQALEAKTIDGKSEITAELLKEAGIISKLKDGIRIIGNEALNSKLSFKVAGVSKGAKESIEKAGGSISIIEVKEPELVNGKLPKKNKAAKKEK